MSEEEREIQRFKIKLAGCFGFIVVVELLVIILKLK